MSRCQSRSNGQGLYRWYELVRVQAYSSYSYRPGGGQHGELYELYIAVRGSCTGSCTLKEPNKNATTNEGT